MSKKAKASPEEKPEWTWPESVEKRSLIVKFEDHDRSEIAIEMGLLVGRKNAVEDQKKTYTSQCKAQIDAIDADLSRHSHALRDGGEYRPVDCRWHFETAGKDANGELVPNPESKTLVRIDTGDVVQVTPITDKDRQTEMPLADEEQEAA